MKDDIKAPEVPVVEVPKTTDDDVLIIDNPRAEVEARVITENNTFPEPEALPEEIKKEEPKVISEKQELDSVERIKKSVQKRIDKVVAQKKSAEEELIEARAEIERLKNQKPQTEPVKSDAPPTPEQVEAYIAKMAEEGNHKEVAAATRYLIKLEKELAMKEIAEAQNKVSKEEEAKKAQTLADWTNLCRDYSDYDSTGSLDSKSDLNLANQSGLLYKTALSLYNDKELHGQFYNDTNVIQGFRRAVADAYREIHQQGLIKQTPKGDIVIPRNPRQVLAEPGTESDETPSTTSRSLSDAEKVREEIRNRNKNRLIRIPS